MQYSKELLCESLKEFVRIEITRSAAADEGWRSKGDLQDLDQCEEFVLILLPPIGLSHFI